MLASLLEMAFSAQIPLSVKFIIDRALIGRDRRMLLLIAGSLAAGSLVVTLTSIGRDYIYAGIVGRIVASLRERMFDHLQRLSMGFYARIEAGDVMSRFSNDAGNLETGLAAGITWGLQPLLDMVLAAALMFALEWRLAILGILLCPVSVLGPRILARRAAAASIAKQEHASGVMITVQETLMAPAVVRAFNLQEHVADGFRDRNRRLFGASLRLGFISSLIERSAGFGTVLLQAVMLIVSGYLAFRGTIGIGTFASFQGLFVSLSYSAMYLAQYTPNALSALGGAVRIEGLLSEELTVADRPLAVELDPLKSSLEFRGVTFSYTGERKDIDRLDLKIAKGESVAVVGPSGSGKSTVLNLLLRFYDPDAGAVLLDGADLRGMKQDSLRAAVGVVFQENFLFNTTIRDNIRLGKPAASDREIENAARAAEIHGFIASLPAGYHTLCGERGSRFSGGQRQRIAIARAILREPSILVLDEATSGLDPATEAAVNRTFERLARGRTMVAVTHRLRTAVGMDRIFVLDSGRLAESGTHSELLSAGGIYARMWTKQSGVRLDGGTGRAHVDAALLAGIPILAGIGEGTRSELTKWFATEHFEDGAFIVRQGDAGDRLYIVGSGTVEVLRNGTHVAKLSDGDYFGEVALLSNEPRNASVRAVGPCTCLSLLSEHFHNLLEREPELKKEVERVAAVRAKPHLTVP